MSNLLNYFFLVIFNIWQGSIEIVSGGTNYKIPCDQIYVTFQRAELKTDKKQILHAKRAHATGN